MDRSRVEPTFFFIEKISFSLKHFSGHFYGQSFIKTVRGPLAPALELFSNASLKVLPILVHVLLSSDLSLFENCVDPVSWFLRSQLMKIYSVFQTILESMVINGIMQLNQVELTLFARLMCYSLSAGVCLLITFANSLDSDQAQGFVHPGPEV